MTQSSQHYAVDPYTLGTADNPYVYTRRNHIYDVNAGDGAVRSADDNASGAGLFSSTVDIKLCDTCYQEYMIHTHGDFSKAQQHACQEIEDDPAGKNIDNPCDCPCAMRAKELLRTALGRRCLVPNHDHRMKMCTAHTYGQIHWYCQKLHPNGTDHEIKQRARGGK